MGAMWDAILGGLLELNDYQFHMEMSRKITYGWVHWHMRIRKERAMSPISNVADRQLTWYRIQIVYPRRQAKQHSVVVYRK